MTVLSIRNLSFTFIRGRSWFYFDPDFYVSDCLLKGISAPLGSRENYLHHYLERGAALGLSPNPLFDEEYYRRQNPNVGQGIQTGKFTSGFDHYVRVGAISDLSPSWFFNASFYKSIHSDLTMDSLMFDGFHDRYSHYLEQGLGKGRAAHWTHLGLKRITPQAVFPENHGQLCTLLGNDEKVRTLFKPLFDYEWMKEKYDWGRGVPARLSIRHYLLNVKADKLSPSPYFDELYYRADPGVDAAINDGVFTCGYEHFVLHGIDERRHPFELFDSRYYSDNNISNDGNLTDALMPPFIHFIQNRNLKPLLLSLPQSLRNISEDSGKGIYERRCALNTARFNGLPFITSEIEVPDISIIIVVRNNYEKTLNCITSVFYNGNENIEIIVFDNGSSDKTQDVMLSQTRIRYIRSEENVGFTIAVNRAAKIAKGRILLLLNNDIELGPQAITLALKRLDEDHTIGAVGAKIVRMHGKLQEAGCIVWQDGSCRGYGRDKDPLDGQVDFARDVDFCSGCFLAVRRSDWEAMDGFDEAYAPAYYEEADFCLRLWDRGQRVVYDPGILIWHFEFGSSALREEPLALMRRNQRYFTNKHRVALSKASFPSPENVERAKLRHTVGPKVLFIEDLIPEPSKGMGFVRSAVIAQVLGRSCGLVSMLGLHNNIWPTGRNNLESDQVEILTNVNVNSMANFLRERIGVYDIMWLSRTHNLARLKEWRRMCPEFFSDLRIILDTEAISATRRFAYAKQANLSADLNDLVQEEIEHLEGIQHICVVNELDRKLLKDNLSNLGRSVSISVLGHSTSLQTTFPSYEDSTDIVLVGSYAQLDGPNADGMLWFDRYVRPLIPDLPGLEFVIAGNDAARFANRSGLEHEYRIVNNPPKMADVFKKARLMVAPTRVAAGVPIKVYDAASHGVPVVMTSLLATQLAWPQKEVAAVAAVAEDMAAMIYDLALNPIAWKRVQALQADLIIEDCNPAKFETAILGLVACSNVPLNPSNQRPRKKRTKHGN